MGATVSIGCKLPHGLVLQLTEAVKTNEGVTHVPIGEPVIINGANSSEIIGGHGITENVDKEFWDKWLASKKDAAYVKNGLIFASDKVASVKAEAAEKKGNKTGMEGIDPAKPGPGLKPEKYEGMPRAE